MSKRSKSLGISNEVAGYQHHSQPTSGLQLPEVLFLLLVFVTLTVIKLVAHFRFGTSFDSAVLGNVAWRLSHGLDSVTTLTGFPHFATHASLIIFLLAPIYGLWPELGLPLTFVLQTASVTLVGAAVLIACSGLGLRRSARWLLLGLTLLSPGAFLAARLDVHEPTLGLGFLAMTIATIVAGVSPARSWWWPILAAACRIEMALGSLVVGIILFRRHERRNSWAAIAAGIGGLSFSLWFIAKAGANSASVAAHFGHLGASPAEVVQGAIRDPWSAIRPLWEREVFISLAFWLLPFGLVVPFFGWRLLLTALPIAGVVLLGVWTPGDQYPHHYWYGFLVAGPMAAALAVSRYPKLLRMLAVSGGAGLVAGWFILANAELNFFGRSNVDAYREIVAIGTEHPEASLSVPDNAVPHLVSRPTIYELPRPFYCATSAVGPFRWTGLPPELLIVRRSDVEVIGATSPLNQVLAQMYRRDISERIAVYRLDRTFQVLLSCVET